MLRYVLRRLLEAVPVIIGISFIAFAVLRLAPGDPVALLIDPNSATAEQIAAVRQQYGLDDPLPVQYVRMISGLLTGQLRSLRTGQSTLAMALDALPTTATLISTTILTGLVVGVALGAISALRPYTRLDDGVTLPSLAGISVPHFWLGLILILVMSENLGWLPASGIRPLGAPSGSRLDSLPFLVLPTIVLATGVIAGFARYCRSNMLEILREDYVRTARSKGLRERAVLVRHAFRNSLITIVTLAGVFIPILLSSGVVVETLFALPGLGRLAVSSAVARDYPLILTTTLFAGAAVILANLLTDVAYSIVDPRIRLAR